MKINRRRLLSNLNGLSDIYVPPPFDYDQPIKLDSNFKVLETDAPSPYWIDALTMHDPKAQLTPILENSNNAMKYAFPSEIPLYLGAEVVQWTPASDAIIAASKEIFENINKVLEVQFYETTDIYSTSVIAISQSSQDKTAGFSYFPNNFFELGSDVFISKKSSQPGFLNDSLTNYDYEVLVHEIGHSLGLKHPLRVMETMSPYLMRKKTHHSLPL